MIKLSDKAKNLKQSGIRSASLRCSELNGINLGQGICDLPILDEIKQAAFDAIRNNKNLYSACEGIMPLREKVTNKIQNFNNIPVETENVLITHGATGAFISTITATLNPGDEVILFEPFYGYHKGILQLHNISAKYVKINVDDFSIDMAELEAAINNKTRAILICTPCNPAGKIFSKQELLAIGHLAEKNNLMLITDEIYEYITYPGHEHTSIAALENFKERTITISGFSKTYNMTGWRLGYVSGPQKIIEKMALIQDLLYICPSTPLQYAAIATLDLPQTYYSEMADLYLKKRDYVVSQLRDMGFKVTMPQGAYYLLADFSELNFKDDIEAANFLMEKAKVATVTGRSFYENPDDGKYILRICFAMNEDKLTKAMQQLQEALG
jgi:aminotransferase